MTKLINQAAQIILKSLAVGGKILIAGNGGSASQAEHFAAELVGRFKKERKPLPAISLASNTALLTALANDYGYENVFSRQIEVLGKKGDILILLSTSGKSKNIIEVAKIAQKQGLKIISLLGKNKKELAPLADLIISINLIDTAKIQEKHLFILHQICQLVESKI